MTVEEPEFRKTMSCFASGVTVVTARDDSGRPVGLTVSAFSSLSLSPPLILICLDKRVANLAAFRRGPFAVNVLAEGQDVVSSRFAEKREDRFEGMSHAPGANGAPLLEGCLAHIECDTHQVADGGDHDIIMGAVTRVARQSEGRPLVYFGGRYASLA